ncbi:SET domain-containing protein SmydA-8-like isoform X1 [Vanessa atalanta]|uniref:SET domain-containing protein SmydA-8-like isoform X1 n=1 Tax=Vanessa atalanta TaxID=42275 RepID=UPI001FCD7357|nr:SET domain-containing protein SmydA-8-like isoform X1 [Vanessa atalanta]
MIPIEQLALIVDQHLGLITCNDDLQHKTKWKIFESPVGGRGLVATEDIKTGEVLFVDHPIIYGPRSGTNIQRGCTVCKKIDSNTFHKCSKCALLLCSEQCQNSGVHLSDCSVISCWSNKVPIEDVDDTLLSRALTSIRALLLDEDQKNLLTSLQAHFHPQHGSEIRNLKDYFDILPQEEEFLFLVTCILDANAFQMATPYGQKEMNLRGLYPVSSLMNHNCVSNTSYTFNADSQMTVKAVKPIRAGTEIFTCYSGMLWGTPARRLHLYKTKHFFCNCERCADPTERGTLLAALKCFSTECSGSLLPIEPLKFNTAWRCLDCGLRVPHGNITTIQGALGSLMGSLDFENIYELEKFFLNRITRYIPKSNQIVVDLQCRLIWEYGEIEGLRWDELSESRLELKESLCRGTLRTVAALGAGDAHLRGLLLYHLHAALAERARRSPDQYEELKSEIEITIEQAYNILQGDISAPPDLELRRRYLGPGCDKPQEERFFILDSPDKVTNTL